MFVPVQLRFSQDCALVLGISSRRAKCLITVLEQYNSVLEYASDKEADFRIRINPKIDPEGHVMIT